MQCASYVDLNDGSVFALVLNQMYVKYIVIYCTFAVLRPKDLIKQINVLYVSAPGFFDDEVLQMTRDASATSNRTIRVNNFRKILR